jgi:membrane-bound lytic murein transglycosylase B
LNGDPWLAIPDTDQGELDDDTEWDRAVGPMQFIPTSWAIFAADGDSDGQQDPHNLYDAALAAADHLCGVGLDSGDRFRQALLGYNRSSQYGSDVIRFAASYSAGNDIANPWDATDDDDPKTSG